MRLRRFGIWCFVYGQTNSFLSRDNPYNDQYYSNDSPELILRKKLLKIDDIKIDELTNLLNDESLWTEQKKIRKELRSIFFIDNYGESGKCAQNY